MKTIFKYNLKDYLPTKAIPAGTVAGGHKTNAGELTVAGTEEVKAVKEALKIQELLLLQVAVVILSLFLEVEMSNRLANRVAGMFREIRLQIELD